MDPIPAIRDDGDVERNAERAVVAQLLREDRPLQWRAADVRDALPDIHPAAVNRALRGLAEAGVIYCSGPFVWLTAAVRRVSALGLIEHAPARPDLPLADLGLPGG